MSVYLLFLPLFVAIGLTIGVIFLPWHKKMGGDGEFSFLRICTLFWPYLLVHYCWRGVKAYLKAWRRYLHSRQSQKLKR